MFRLHFQRFRNNCPNFLVPRGTYVISPLAPVNLFNVEHQPSDSTNPDASGAWLLLAGQRRARINSSGVSGKLASCENQIHRVFKSRPRALGQ